MKAFYKNSSNVSCCKINKIFNQATSVPGIGKITAFFLICFTNEFTLYSNPRQLACYAGVVPFEYTSGKSVRAKPKVHYMANKKLKKQMEEEYALKAEKTQELYNFEKDKKEGEETDYESNSD